MTIQEMREERQHVLFCARDLLANLEKEGKDPSEDQVAQIRAWQDEAVTLENKIKAAEDLEALRGKVAADVLALNKSEGRKTVATEPASSNFAEGRTFEVPGVLQTNLRAFKADSYREANYNAYRAGMWLRACFQGDHRAQRYCRDNGIAAEFRTQSEAVNTAGGFLVPNELSTAIITLREEYGVFRKYCRVLPMGSSTMTIPRWVTTAAASFVGENTAFTPGDTSFDGVTLTAKKLMAGTVFSSELAEDAVISIADLVASDLAYKFALKEDQCGFTGDGSATYGGIKGLSQIFTDGVGSYTGAVDAASGHDLSTEIDAADLAKVMAALPIYAKVNAAWFCSSTCRDLVFSRLMAAGGGNNTITLAGKVMPAYLGYPIVECQVIQSGLSTINNVPMLYFGDLSKAATLGDRRGMRLSSTDQRYWEYDQIALKATERIDINVHDFGSTSVAGPIVALIGNT